MPRIYDLASGKTVLALTDTRWSMDSATWGSDSVVSLRLRKFPGDHLPMHLEVLVDCTKGTAVVEAGQVSSLAELEAVLDAAFTKAPSRA